MSRHGSAGAGKATSSAVSSRSRPKRSAYGTPATSFAEPNELQRRREVAILHLKGKGKVGHLADEFGVERCSCNYWVRTFRTSMPPAATVEAVLKSYEEKKAKEKKAADAAAASAASSSSSSAAAAASKKPTPERRRDAFRQARRLSQGNGGGKKHSQCV